MDNRRGGEQCQGTTVKRHGRLTGGRKHVCGGNGQLVWMKNSLWRAFTGRGGHPEPRRNGVLNLLRGTVHQTISILIHTVHLVCMPCYMVCRHIQAHNIKIGDVECRPTFAKITKIVRQRECPRHSPTMSHTFSTKPFALKQHGPSPMLLITIFHQPPLHALTPHQYMSLA